MKKNVITNLSFEAYESKFKDHKTQLMTFTKKEVEEFDKQTKNVGKNYVLRNRNWALIGDTYYELPKPIRLSWFKGLSTAGKLVSCIIPVAAVGAIGGASYGIYCAVNNNGGIVVDIDAKATDIAEIESKELDKDGNFNVIIKSKEEDKEIIGVEVKIGEDILKETSEYTFEAQNLKNKYKVVILKDALKNHKGKVVITPLTDEKSDDLPEYLNYVDLDDNAIAIKCNKNLKEYPKTIDISSNYKINGKTKKVDQIYYQAFYNGEKNNSISFETLVIPDSVTIIGEGICHGNSSLKSLKIGENVKIIGEYSFGNTGLTTIEIPKNVNYIGYNAFASNEKSNKLSNIIFDDEISTWTISRKDDPEAAVTIIDPEFNPHKSSSQTLTYLTNTGYIWEKNESKQVKIGRVKLETNGNGTAEGAGVFHVGDTCTVCAIPEDGATFVGWYDINSSSSDPISTDANYTFKVESASIYLGAKFSGATPIVDGLKAFLARYSTIYSKYLAGETTDHLIAVGTYNGKVVEEKMRIDTSLIRQTVGSSTGNIYAGGNTWSPDFLQKELITLQKKYNLVYRFGSDENSFGISGVNKSTSTDTYQLRFDNNGYILLKNYANEKSSLIEVKYIDK